SQALEQIGTEADCGRGGHEQSSAWFELVPAASDTISLHVAAGDKMRATVTVTGHEVAVHLTDQTTGHAFQRHLHARLIDTTSAEWIVEAPSLCSGSACQTLPLADFGSTGFAFAKASSTSGQSGTIQSPAWNTTSISLFGSDRQLSDGGSRHPAVTAVPGPLGYGGSLFGVVYDGGPASTTPAIVREPGAELVHGARQ
ncbi:MAG: G1 family glutamic endopeptidase, partial [Solirubrobacteraceae bacterium]